MLLVSRTSVGRFLLSSKSEAPRWKGRQAVDSKIPYCLWKLMLFHASSAFGCATDADCSNRGTCESGEYIPCLPQHEDFPASVHAFPK